MCSYAAAPSAWVQTWGMDPSACMCVCFLPLPLAIHSLPFIPITSTGAVRDDDQRPAQRHAPRE